MPSIQRLSDINSADAPIIDVRQSSVFANNLLVSVDGSDVAGHGPGTHAHPFTANGNSSVFVEYIPVNTTGDLDTCGHPRIQGSADVSVGG